MNTTIPTDPRLRKRAIAVVSITLLVGLVFLYFFHGFLRGVEALATASPQLAVEKLNSIRTATRGVTLFSATALASLLGCVAFSVYRAGQWPPPGWRVVYTMSMRTGRQALIVAMFFLLLALAALVYGAVIVSLSEPEEEIEVPMREVQGLDIRVEEEGLMLLPLYAAGDCPAVESTLQFQRLRGQSLARACPRLR
jgi:hypothetical protein